MIEGRHFQNAYLTRNMDRAIKLFEARADIRKLLQFGGSRRRSGRSGNAAAGDIRGWDRSR